jgi:CHAT domain-containing protein
MSKAFPPLPGTLNEGRAVAGRFRGSVLLSGRGATLAALEENRARAEVFHFAGHGFSNAGNGGLLLSPGQGAEQGAGVLEGKAMSEQDWGRCRLAVLSACSAGTGEARGPVNPESLVRGLLWSGVARVVASRWNMDTQSGVPFMDQFYNGLISGDDTAAALQHAAQSLRQDAATRHPYYWAGFQSFGTR